MSIDKLFRDAEQSDHAQVYTRASETHPVDIFIGKDLSSLAIQVRSLDKPPTPPRLSAISVDVYPPKAGKWWTVLRLLRPELRYIFVKLAEDLLRATEKGEATAGRIVITRLAQWQRLLAPGQGEVLSDSAKRGLAAELAFLRDELIPRLGVRDGVGAWKGPFAAPRDFEGPFCDIEVKAIREGSRTIGISSLEQLEVESKPVYLWVQAVELGPPHEGGCPDQSLASLVQDVRELVTLDAVAADQFEQALAAAGYRDRFDYGREPLTIGRHWCLQVRDDFPRIERSSTAPGVLTCKYDISWPEVSRFDSGTWLKDRP